MLNEKEMRDSIYEFDSDHAISKGEVGLILDNMDKGAGKEEQIDKLASELHRRALGTTEKREFFRNLAEKVWTDYVEGKI